MRLCADDLDATRGEVRVYLNGEKVTAWLADEERGYVLVWIGGTPDHPSMHLEQRHGEVRIEMAYGTA